MTIDNISTLKKYIHWFDLAVFNDPIPVYDSSEKLRRGYHIAGYHNKGTVLRYVFGISILVLITIAAYCVAIPLLPFICLYDVLKNGNLLDTKKDIQEANMKVVIAFKKVHRLRNCYVVNMIPTSEHFTQGQLLAMAAHEVRHRVQFEHYYSHEIRSDLEDRFKLLTDHAKESVAKITAYRYKKSEIPREVDSRLVETIILGAFTSEFPDETLATNKEIEDFIKKYARVLTAKYPESP